MVKGFTPLLALLLFGLGTSLSAQTDPAPVKYDPAVTTIAIMPVVDRSGEKVVERRKRQEETGYYNACELFVEHGFKLADPDAVVKAIKDLDLDLQDEESYRRENFYKVAGATNADLVLFVEVMSTGEDRKKRGIFSDKEEIQGKAEVKIWLLDARRKKAIFSALRKEGKAAGVSKVFATNEGTQRRANAVANAVKEQLEAFINAYPKVSKDGLKGVKYLPTVAPETGK